MFKPPTKPTKYPKWSYLEVNEDYYLVMTKTRKKFISYQAFISWEVASTLATKEALINYPIAGNVGYRPGSILVDMDSLFWYVEDDLFIRQIRDPKFFSVLGYNESEAFRVSDYEIEMHRKGDKITLD